MGMAAIMFNSTEPFEQIVNILSTEGPILNLVKTAQAALEKKIFKKSIILSMYIVQRQEQITPGDKILILTKKSNYFNHALYVLAISL